LARTIVLTSGHTSNTQPPRRRRSDGEATREFILQSAARLATVDGIDGLSIGRLAEACGMSKSGVFAHFGSKEELQLATVERAGEIFSVWVLDPAAAATSGLDRLRALPERYLVHVEQGVYPGGCFFASLATEVAARRSPLRDLAADALAGWLGALEQAARDAQAEGALSGDEDPQQLAFELDGFLLVANLQFVLSGEAAAMTRARRAIDRRIASVLMATNLPSAEDRA
jgi:AcrR family transcriptional regulator